MNRLLSSLFVLSLICLLSLPTHAKETLVFPTLTGDIIIPELSHLNVHLIAHTHDDIGWLKTVDQYYYDSEKSITIQGVQYILDSVVPVLNMDSTKKFIYVEMGFFKRWWNEQSSNTQAIVKKLVQNGQLEFINGGYCMNDEADVYYEDSIDQMTLGHQFLLQNFNVIPQIGWHIDPFGHASAQAALFAQMGFNAFFFSRIDYQDKITRLADKGMEMMWIPNTSQGIENAMFTHINYYNYASPPHFDFDIISTDQPIMDDPALEEYNVNTSADEFVAWFRQMQNSYQSTELMHTAGEDFHYMAAQVNFKNLDKLINYIKSVPSYDIDFIYSTPSQYLKAVFPLGLTYPNKTDDFFPYADNDSAFWTGYFTSRVSVKALVRREGRLLQAARRLATQGLWDKSSQFAMNNFNRVDGALAALEEAMAIGQHHDAVTGTEKQAVAEDYKLHFAIGEGNLTQNFLYPYFEEKIQNDLGTQGVQLSMCDLNISAVFCNVTYTNLGQGKTVLVAIYNSAPASRTSNIRIKVPNGNVQVVHSSGQDINTDVICSNSTDSTDCDLFFADQFSAYGTNYYYLLSSSTSNQVNPAGLSFNSPYTINSNQSITAQSLSSFSFKYCLDSTSQNCYSSQFNLQYNYYESYQGDGQKSGAYIFRPSQNTFTGSISYDSAITGQVFQGKNLLQIQLNGAKIITVIRIYNDMTNGIEVQTFVNSINTDDGQGKEVVMVVQVPSISNNKTFYTDSMGMEMQQRILNYRSTWNLNVTQPVAGNYYPVQSTIYVQDTGSQETLAIIPDRAQSGSSITNGEIELMIHRRTVDDDARGVDEPLNERDWDGQGMRQWVTHTFLFTKPGYIATSYRQVQTDNDMTNLVLLAPSGKGEFNEMIREIMPKTNMLELDPRIKLMTRPLATNKFVLRFQNMDEVDTLNVSTQVFVNSDLGKGTVTEMSLSLNQPKSDMVKNRWNWNSLDLSNPAFAKTDYLNSDEFSLRPLEIRSFIVNFGSSEREEIINI